MRIVLDTNILISALIFPGVSAEIFDFIVQNHEIILSEWIIKEFIRKCRDKFKIPSKTLRETLRHLRDKISIQVPEGSIPDICRDPDDNNILWIANTVRAEIILTGDQDLLILKEFGNSQILSPREYKAIHMVP